MLPVTVPRMATLGQRFLGSAKFRGPAPERHTGKSSYKSVALFCGELVGTRKLPKKVLLGKEVALVLC